MLLEWVSARGPLVDEGQSGNNGGACVGVAGNLAGVIGVRDSKDPAGPALAFDPAAWTRFLVLAKRC
ncbi:DUF397 domain-containing protein [Micromonospora sp. DT201]|uniref:DUF397 domain-containing protein n=1 Tax=Micromonospora sp. DT201 TaxID=3393442 RepID=UPI003CEECCEA